MLALCPLPRIGCGYDETAELGVGGEYAVIPGEIGSWSRDQGRKLGEELQRLEDEVRRAVLERVFELVDDLTRDLSGQSIKCERRSGNVSA